MDEQPERLTFLDPQGQTRMVLARDRAQFEARGWSYVGPFGDEAGPSLPVPQAGESGNDSPAPSPEPEQIETPKSRTTRARS